MLEASRANMPTTYQTSEFCTEALEALVTEGWVKASYDPSLPRLRDYPKGV
jgi:hypothetical protein